MLNKFCKKPLYEVTQTMARVAMGVEKAEPGSMRPRASPMICMVEAVPMKEQAPQEGQACCLYQVS